MNLSQTIAQVPLGDFEALKNALIQLAAAVDKLTPETENPVNDEGE